MCYLSVAPRVLRHSCWKHSYDGSVTSCTCQTVAFQSRFSVDNSQLVAIHSVGLSGDTKTPTRRIWKKCGMNPLLSAAIHKTAQHGDPCVLKQSPSSKTREPRFFSINMQSVSKRHNHWATSAPGLVIIVRGSALQEFGCTLTNSLIDDKDNRSVDFDGAVRVCGWVCVCVCVCVCVMRGRLYSSCVRSCLLHGTETCPVRKENEVALQWAEMRMVRWMCDVKLFTLEFQVKSWESN